MAKEKDYVKLFEWFKDTDIRKKILEYLEGRVSMRVEVLKGKTGELGVDFDTRYSQHDLMRSEVRFIENVMMNIPEEIIAQELNKQKQAEAEKLEEAQAEVEALSELVSSEAV